MKSRIHSISNIFFNRELDFRVRIFNVQAIAGILVSLISAIVFISIGDPLKEPIKFMVFCLFSVGILWYSTKTGQYQRCYLLTIAIVFLIGFPMFFIEGRRYYGVMPFFFIFAVVFTIFMLEGKKALVMAVLELIVYVGVCIYAYLAYQVDPSFYDNKNMMILTIFGFVAVSVALGATMFLHFKLYNQQQRELEKAREEALKLSEVKNTFLANMSHEIRTPVNVMLGMTEMVLRDSRDENVRGYAGKIQNAGKMLLVLVSNILDVSKIESGKLVMMEDSYYTTLLIQELFELGSESARKKGLSFEVCVEEGFASELWGDFYRLKQIVTNFLSNAAKYTNAGSITLKFGWKKSENANEIILCIFVTDTGVGIQKEDFAMLFGTFSRLDFSIHRNIEGSGLGLAIAKDLTKRMNGEIFVESEFGKGSVFWVEIPQRVMNGQAVDDWMLAPKEEDSTEESFTAPDARVLVVDDNLENLETVKALLRRTLMQVDLVGSGEQCIEAVHKINYHIILMDYMMPDIDGVETLRRLRKEVPGFRTPVVVLTANAISGTMEGLLQEGFVDYLTKPVQARVLEKAIRSCLDPALVTRRTIYQQSWVTSKLKETLARDLAACGITLEEGLKNTSGDLLLLARLAEIFVTRYPESLARVKNVFSQESVSPNLEELRYLVHSLKSSAGSVGATEFSFFAKQIETGCKKNDRKVIDLAMPLFYLFWERAQRGLMAFAAHVRTIEPQALEKAKTYDFQPKRLVWFIKRRIRQKAIQELDLLIAKKGTNCPVAILEVKQALTELNFDKAKHLLMEIGLWEDLKDG